MQEPSENLVVQPVDEVRQWTKNELDRLSNEELILLFQKGIAPAFDVLVLRFKDPLLNFIYRYVGNQDDAMDILQDTFIRVYHKKHMYQTIAKFSTWIYTIAGNLAKSSLRRPYRRNTTPIVHPGEKNDEYETPLPDHDPTPDRLTDSAFKAARIQKALGQLPAVFREAVILRDIQDMTYEEIADIIGMPIGTVKSRINRGRAQLQELLKDIYD